MTEKRDNSLREIIDTYSLDEVNVAIMQSEVTRELIKPECRYFLETSLTLLKERQLVLEAALRVAKGE